jgi:acetoin utilization protein AcuC
LAAFPRWPIGHDGHKLATDQPNRASGEVALVEGAALIWTPALAAYDLGEAHPLNPLRLTLSVELMQAFGLLTPGVVLAPREAREDELLLVHSIGYVEAVREAGDWALSSSMAMGLGTEDNPVFPGMHEIAALTCGGSILAIEQPLSGGHRRTFSIAGGMHHAHRSRAAGFSIYNDAAVGIATARRAHPGLRVLYIDIDAHHGDGVQEAFAGSDEVLTISIHESGLYAFPGTGFPGESGYGSGEGFSANVPLPAYATDECFDLAFEELVVPLAHAFAPDLIVAQLGVDAHYADPQTDLGLTIPGYRRLVRGIIALADELCEGRLACVGGGGYHVVEVVPLAWTWVLAQLGGVQLSDEVPESWREHVRARLGCEPPTSMGEADSFDSPPERAANVLALTKERVREAREAVFPHHGLKP